MATNPYFSPFSYKREQSLAEDIIVESIKIYGIDVKYLPRTIVNQDFLLGEDPLSKFDSAIAIEAYIKNIQNFDGEQDFLSKFNLEIRDQMTLTIARKRFTEIASEKLLNETSFTYQLETADSGGWGNTESYLLETGTANGYSITTSRPMEGDLIFFPLNNKLYEIMFVEHENIFYQHGKLYTYDLHCELFDRDSRLDTGNTAIDTIETTFSLDMLMNQLLQEDGSVLLTEEGGSYINEFRLEDTASMANNEVTRSEALTYVRTERTPFGWNE